MNRKRQCTLRPAAWLWVGLVLLSGGSFAQPAFTLRNQYVEVAIDEKGRLTRLQNVRTGHNYAAGKPLWRLYYDRKDWKDNEVTPEENVATVRQEGNALLISYPELKGKRETIQVRLTLRIWLEENQVRFGSELTNQEPHSIVRELQYPLVGHCQLPADHQLLTTWWGGQLFADPKKQIRDFNATYPPYYPPSQYFLQMDQKYPKGLAANCFAFVGKQEGLYLGSHDTTFEDTGHGLRLYPGKKFVFDQLEAGFYKYPHCLYGQTWQRDANVIAPFSGDWHQTARLYRTWADTWWRHREEPQWVKRMKGWQRIIMKHQYGEVLFPYADLGTRVKTVGEGVGLNAVLLHGWHNGGHDADYPHYVTDPKQGGDTAFKRQIAQFQQNGGAVLLYFSGRLIDKASDFYKTGEAKDLCIRDNNGTEISDQYLYRGPGTFTGSYDTKTLTAADMRNPRWQQMLLAFADKALAFGVRSVFYDQMGRGDLPHWDLSGEFPVPHVNNIADNRRMLHRIHAYIDQKNADMAIGSELLTDVVAMEVDYIHARTGATDVLNPDWETRGEKPRPVFFVDWFRYAFPEVILSNRDIRDDTDIERRVNHAVLKGLRNDVEIYRCRALIDDTPHYQAYLTKINGLKDRFADLLLLGRYTDTEGFTHSNPDIEARRFENGNKAAIVLTQSHLPSATTALALPEGYAYAASGAVGDAAVQPGQSAIQVTLKKHGLAVIVLQKVKSLTTNE